MDRSPELAEKVRKICAGHADDDPHAERYRIWVEYLGEWAGLGKGVDDGV